MKVKPEKGLTKRHSRPFLILPLLDDVSLKPQEEVKMPKNPGLKLFTKTWPPNKNKKNKEENDRPLTATLEKPTILNINLIGKIDMSTLRKEFLNISNLCRMPLILKTKKAKSTIARPLSLPPTQVQKKKKRTDTSEEDDESISIRSARKSKVIKPNNRLKHLESLCKKNSIKVSVSDANNNKPVGQKSEAKTMEMKPLKLPRKPKANLKNDATKSTKLLPQPCTTCGRPEQPERFHSHPFTPKPQTKKVEEMQKVPVKSTVQKPIAMKYKSKQTADKNLKQPPIARKSSLPAQKLLHTPPVTAMKVSTPEEAKRPEGSPRVRSARRLLTCYICGREFGTASLPLHEPKCLEKWQRENSKLPSNLQRKSPLKPDSSLTQEEFNNRAWEASQATLIPCANCGRTFYPDRLAVHQKSCKTPQPNKKSFEQLSMPSPVTNISSTPLSEPCYICGKIFRKNSINLHEKGCLKKWNVENDSLPESMRTPPPIKGDIRVLVEPITNMEIKEERQRISSARRPQIFPCYLCGKLFTVNSINIHEPQCLKMWKMENEKLPQQKRRPQPSKPEFKYTDCYETAKKKLKLAEERTDLESSDAEDAKKKRKLNHKKNLSSGPDSDEDDFIISSFPKPPQKVLTLPNNRDDGRIDIEAMCDASWETHLSQLVPCRFCSRTFNPDRVDIHERNCKG